MTLEFVYGRSGVGLSEHAYQYAVAQQAAWVGNNAQAHISMLRATVREELAFVLEQTGMPREQMEQAVAIALEQWGLQAQAEQDPTTLSSGQTRRLAIAGALLQHPQALVLDCPLDGLDLQAVEQVQRSIAEFAGKVRVYDRTATALAQQATQIWELDDAHQLRPGTLQPRPLPEALPRATESTPALVAQQCGVLRGSARLAPIDCEIPAGSITHIAGPNGVGKTSWFRACLGLSEYTGLLEVPQARGFAPTAMDEAFLGRSVLEELRTVGGEQRAAAMVEFAGLQAYAHQHPLDVPASVRRIVLLAVAMVAAPSVVFIDEPTVGLDHAGYSWLARLMQQYVAGEFHALIGEPIDATMIRPQVRYPKEVPAATPPWQGSFEHPTIVWSCHDHAYAEAFSDHTVQLG